LQVKRTRHRFEIFPTPKNLMVAIFDAMGGRPDMPEMWQNAKSDVVDGARSPGSELR
jgi:hypothetical protein